MCCVDSLIVVSGSGFLLCKQQPDSLALYLLVCILIQHSDNYMMGGGCLGNGSLSDFFQQTHSSVLKLPSRMLSSLHEKQEPNSCKRVVEMFTVWFTHFNTVTSLLIPPSVNLSPSTSVTVPLNWTHWLGKGPGGAALCHIANHLPTAVTARPKICAKR